MCIHDYIFLYEVFLNNVRASMKYFNVEVFVAIWIIMVLTFVIVLLVFMSISY